MFNKALIATAVLVASAGLAYANGGTYAPEPVVAGPTHSCYVGVAISRDFIHAKSDTVSSEITDSITGETILTHTHQTDIGSDGWDGELNIGYGGTFQDHYYLGVEVFGSVSSANADWTAAGVVVDNVGANALAVSANGTFKLRYQYGIDLIPGVKISDSTMLYAKIGYVRGGFRATLNNLVVLAATTNGINPFVLNTNGDTHSSSKNANGLQLGIGLETMVTNNVSAKIEYDWNRYSNFNNRGGFRGFS